MNSFAILCDLHLPSETSTVKEDVWHWALDALNRLRPDCILGLGDLTGSGTVAAARRIRAGLESLGIPFLLTPGNAELRNSAESPEALRILQTATEYDPFFLFDTSQGRILPEDRRRLEQLPPGERIGLTHRPPEALGAGDRKRLCSAFGRGALTGLITGHYHRDRSEKRLEMVRGLDPDKAVGGVPAVTFFLRRGDGWKRGEVIYSEADPSYWSPPEKQEWLEHLGISGMNRPLEALREAGEHGIAALELRTDSLPGIDPGKLKRAVDAWRCSGGRCLSMHLTDSGWRDGAFRGAAELTGAVRKALDLRCDRVTCHVPRGTVDDCLPRLEELADRTAGILRRLTDNGIAIGIENLHMRPGDPSDGRRGFGFLPAECRRWITLLRERCGPETGFHLDIGHARNNAPFSAYHPLSDWYASLGAELNGMHLHQVRLEPDGRLVNHTAFTEPFGMLIPLSSLFLAWRSGQLRHAPMFLEIREGSMLDSWKQLRAALAASKGVTEHASC